jgi:hypothetical protein
MCQAFHQKHTTIAFAVFIIGFCLVLPPAEAGEKPPSPVEVVNTQANPVPIQDMDNPARQSVQHSCVCSIPGGSAIDTDSVLVPLGKRLVIEFVSVHALLPTGQIPEVQVFTGTGALPGGTTSMGHQIALTGPLASAVTDIYQASQPVRLYADPGSEVLIHVARNQTGGAATFKVTWTGHLVDLP